MNELLPRLFISLALQASLVTLGPVYVGGAAVFEVEMLLKPGVTGLTPLVTCTDLGKAVPIAASLLDDESGWLEPFPPKVKIRGSDGLPEVSTKKLHSDGIRTEYGKVKNFHPTKDITAKLNVQVKALEAGTHTCQLTFLHGGTNPTVDLTFEASESPATPPSNVRTITFIIGTAIFNM